MKSLILWACLLAATRASAALCSQARTGEPCTPDPGKPTDDAKNAIIALIKAAQAAEPIVKKLEADYRRVRNDPNATVEEQFQVFEKLRLKKLGQDHLYEKALQKTGELYHVGPKNQSVTIGAPFDPEIAYVEGLQVAWSPQVTDSGPGVKLAVKVIGADKKAHYSGTTSMNPAQPDGMQGVTLEDGRVLIAKGMLDLAVAKNNLGILARVLSHEAIHFNNLSKPPIDSSGRRVGWDDVATEERRAYWNDIYYSKVFGLDKAARDALQAQFDAQVAALTSGNIPSRGVSPVDEAVWKRHYEDIQINLGDEYEKLQARVAEARREQARLQEELNPPKKNFWESGDMQKFGRDLAKLKQIPLPTNPEYFGSGYVPPPPLSRAFPKLSAFATEACRAPDQVAFEMFLTPYYDHTWRQYDDAEAGRIAESMDSCSRQLFLAIIQLLRANDWRQADRQWIRNAVAYFSRPAPEAPVGGYSPPSNYGGGNRGGNGGSAPTPPPAVKHDAEGEALEQLREIERRKRWGLRPVR